MIKKLPCEICKKLTNNLFNIQLTATPICENCANAIFIQQATWYVQNEKTGS